MKSMDFTCKSEVNKIFPGKIWAVFYKNYYNFLREAIAAVRFA